MRDQSPLSELVITSVRDPALAANMLLVLSVDRRTLWTALLLMAVLNTLIQQIGLVLIPGSSPFPGVFDSALIYFCFVYGTFVLIVFSIYWVGRSFGGHGTMENVMVTIVWLQFLREIVESIGLLLFFVAPTLSLLLVFAATLIGFWMLIHFINQAHDFQNIGKTILILIASFIAMIVMATILLSLIGVGNLGIAHV